MDPSTLILTALATGAAAAAEETAGGAIKDAYQGLKALLQRRFAGKPAAEVALAKHEEKPEVWEPPLKDALSETSADRDEKIIKAAQKVMEQSDPQGAAEGKYVTHITGNVQGWVQGDHAHVTQHFGEMPKQNS